MSEQLVFLSGKRTPFGANGGFLKDESPVQLGVAAAKAALEQAGVQPEDIDHTIIGNVLQSSSDGIYITRHVALKAGVPKDRPSLQLNRLCGSGFEVIVEAYRQMQTGESRIALVGGSENMSMAPYVSRSARWGMKMGDQKFVDSLFEGLFDQYAKMPMAITAENLAERYKISRAESDEFALASQKRTKDAIAKNFFESEIAPYEITDRKGKVHKLEKDEHPRPESTQESLGKLKPVFKKDGVVTAGNASGIVDGAAMLVVATESYAKEKGLKPLGKLLGYGIVGCEPTEMGIGPAPAIRQALDRTGMKLDQIDLIEVNEAFAPQTLAVAKELELDQSKLNVNGGAIAIGHPLAASGSRIMSTLLYALRNGGHRYGIGAACIGGGQGIALVVEANQ